MLRVHQGVWLGITHGRGVAASSLGFRVCTCVAEVCAMWIHIHLQLPNRYTAVITQLYAHNFWGRGCQASQPCACMQERSACRCTCRHSAWSLKCWWHWQDKNWDSIWYKSRPAKHSCAYMQGRGICPKCSFERCWRKEEPGDSKILNRSGLRCTHHRLPDNPGTEGLLKPDTKWIVRHEFSARLPCSHNAPH